MKLNPGWKQKMLIIAGGLLIMLAMTASECGLPGGCYCGDTTSSKTVERVTATPDQIEPGMAVLNPRGTYLTGDPVRIKLGGTWLTANPTADFKWDPPSGASGFIFPAGYTPEPGGPPFVFKNISKIQAEAGFVVEYQTADYQDTNYDTFYFQDYLHISQVVEGEEIERTSVVQHTWRNLKAAAEPARTAIGDNTLFVTLPGSDPVTKWDVYRAISFPHGLTADNCQEMIASLQSGNTFSAVRLPVADEVLAETDYTLPVVISGSTFPKLQLLGGPLNASMPLEIRPAVSDWANQYLPAAPGETWVALGVDMDADLSQACNFVINDMALTLLATLPLDLSSRPDACEGCDLASFFCYEAGSSTFMPQGLDLGEYTCLGPVETELQVIEHWLLEEMRAAENLKPGDPLHLVNYVYNADTSAHTFSIASAVSPLAAGWSIHPGQAGNPDEPDLTQTVSGPFEVPGNSQYNLHILGTVPAGTTAGSYPYRMTVSVTGMNPPEMSASSLIIVTADGSLPPVADPLPEVGLTGSAHTGAIPAGENITYTFTIHNSGAQPLSGITLTDTLPANTTYIFCAGADSCAQSSGSVTWNLASLGINQSRSVTLLVQANPGLANGTVISNSAYGVITAQSVSASGTPIHVTIGTERRVFMPFIRR